MLREALQCILFELLRAIKFWYFINESTNFPNPSATLDFHIFKNSFSTEIWKFILMKLFIRYLLYLLENCKSVFYLIPYSIFNRERFSGNSLCLLKNISTFFWTQKKLQKSIQIDFYFLFNNYYCFRIPKWKFLTKKFAFENLWETILLGTPQNKLTVFPACDTSSYLLCLSQRFICHL